VFDDALLELDEGGDPAAAGPSDPHLERFDGLVVAELEHQPETFLEQVGPVQPRVGLGDPGKLGLLPDGEVSGFFHNAYRACFNAFAWPVARPALRWCTAPRASFQAWRRTSSRASVAHRTTWKGSAQRTALTQRSPTTSVIQSAPSALTG